MESRFEEVGYVKRCRGGRDMVGEGLYWLIGVSVSRSWKREGVKGGALG